jgi:DNA-binding Lrp family transcriptional regulator
MQSDATDRLDRQILHCLQLDPRAAYRRIADVVGMSEQTVARRHRRLTSAGIVRVVATAGPAQVDSSWMMRIQCRPSAVRAMAEVLADQDNVAWVSVVGGGSEVLCSLRLRHQDESHQLLLQRLPRTAEVLGLSAHAILHIFVHGNADDWTGYDDLLSAEQRARLLGAAGSEDAAEPRSTAYRPEEIDRPLMTMLAVDGRATVKDLATHCKSTEARVSRRLEVLSRTDWLRFEVDIAMGMLGFHTTAVLWLIIDPSQLHAAGNALAEHSQVAFVAAVSGTSNLMASVVCHDPAELYAYISSEIASVPGVRQLEISLIMHNVKHERSREHRNRLRE